MSPSKELVTEWILIAEETSSAPRFLTFATLAAEWGAKQEREACAKVCEDEGSVDDLPMHYAEAIRARGEVKP